MSGRRPAWQRPGYLFKRAVLMEWRGYKSIWRQLARRPRVPAGMRAHDYHRAIAPMLTVFLLVCAIEVVVVDIMVHRWPAVRLPLLLLGIWTVAMMAGQLCGVLSRPHAVGDDGIRVRYGPEIDVPLSWATIDSVELRSRTRRDKEPALTTAEGRTTYHLRVADQTNLDITLEEPTTIRLPHGTERVDVIAVYADDPKAFLADVRRVAGAPESRQGVVNPALVKSSPTYTSGISRLRASAYEKQSP
ncbi:hypothetical protein [Blastococcus sp. Marseille-P5729]|uniref:hypothetical protein n=1 Tax=Blastococcus sp. Marseille-P5729 TaxID=2086582 RepID=UPI00131C145B|nr:hypothetical protein [Blastococcus sp. Marseille-P5729]